MGVLSGKSVLSVGAAAAAAAAAPAAASVFDAFGFEIGICGL